MNKEKEILEKLKEHLQEIVKRNIVFYKGTGEDKKYDPLANIPLHLEKITVKSILDKIELLENEQREKEKNTPPPLSSYQWGIIIREQKEIVRKKWEGKTVYDSRGKGETFIYDHLRDWEVIHNYPERFIDISEIN